MKEFHLKCSYIFRHVGYSKILFLLGSITRHGPLDSRIRIRLNSVKNTYLPREGGHLQERLNGPGAEIYSISFLILNSKEQQCRTHRLETIPSCEKGKPPGERDTFLTLIPNLSKVLIFTFLTHVIGKTNVLFVRELLQSS